MASVTEDQMKDLAKHAEEKKAQYEKKKGMEDKKQEEEKLAKLKEDKIEAFHKKFHSSDDLEDQLQELSDFLCVSNMHYSQENTEATTVYIGKLAKPKKEIDDEADDTAHVDEEALEQIEIIHASPKEFDFLVGKTIKPGEGVTHQLFGTTAEGEGDEQPPQEEGEGEEKPEKSDEPKHLFVDQVFREKKMKFFKVPSLGSYLAIKLSYHSCMSDVAIKEAIVDKIDVDKRREEQEIARKEYEEEQEIAKENKDENADEGEGEKVWEEINEKDFITHENKYTV